MNINFLKRSCILLLSLVLSACAVGPDFKPIDMDIGEAYLNAPEGEWQKADQIETPEYDPWWLSFNDADLNNLLDELNENNLDIAQAQAQFESAQATLSGTRSGLFPTVDFGSSKTRSGQGRGAVDNSYSLSSSVSWEPDLWGRVRRSIEADDAAMLASKYDLDAIRLSMQKTLAETYFDVRASELQDDFLTRTLTEYERALNMTQNRYDAGIASSADVAAARTQLEQAKVEKIRQSWQRQQQINAIALLLGKTPAAFNMPSADKMPTPPEVPVGVPSMLLIQRPDVASAEQRVAQANAQIGVAQSAWFPDITISAEGGYRAAEFASWLTAPARFWALGPSLALTIFDAGARSAKVKSAQADYDAQAAAYRKTVLDAIREVEDYLVQSQALVSEQQAQEQALIAARETLRQVTNQYREGLIDYLDVVQAQTSAFNAEQNAIDLQAQRLKAAVLLTAAQGG